MFVFFVGCGKYALKYDLPEEPLKSKKPHPFHVVVTTFSDIRPREEHTNSVRGSNDYTSDDEFIGQVDKEISKMVAKHVAYANVFAGLRYVDLSIADLRHADMDSLHARGFYAVLTGEIRHFSGYYERNTGREFLYGIGFGCLLGVPPLFMNMYKEKTSYVPTSTWQDPLGGWHMSETPFTTREYDPLPMYLSAIGFPLGGFIGDQIEKSYQRNIEQACALSLRLISTSTHRVVWEDSVTVQQKERKAAGGTNKFELAVTALHDVVSQLIYRISSASFDVAKP
jgi:hypothetical protein